MKKAAVFIRKYSIGKSSPVICMLDLLSNNYHVDLFIQDVSYLNASVLKKSTINLINIKNKGSKNIFEKIKQIFISLFGMDNNKTNECKGNDDYDCYLSFDPHGFLLCKQLFPHAKPFYYSLELYFKDNCFNLDYPEDVMNKERAEINSIKGLIIQSNEREMLFRKEYNLSDHIPTLLLPVTYLQPSIKEKSRMLRKKHNISDDKKIALHLGGIQEYHSCIELALAFSRLDKWVLIFHGYYFGEYIEKFKDTLERHNIKNVIISKDVFDLIEEVDPILMSSDIGLAWYNDVSPNFTSAGKSSGKISAYLRFGLPVIAKKYNSTFEAIENTGCGVCVNDFDEISAAVQKIEGNYPIYAESCRKEYDNVYWFENYRESLLRFLRGN